VLGRQGPAKATATLQDLKSFQCSRVGIANGREVKTMSSDVFSRQILHKEVYKYQETAVYTDV
jgi:hypothetical protein